MGIKNNMVFIDAIEYSANIHIKAINADKCLFVFSAINKQTGAAYDVSCVSKITTYASKDPFLGP